MDEIYYCKFCGITNTDFFSLLSGMCSKSPNDRHKLYEGTKRGRQGYDKKYRFYGKNYHYICMYCGKTHVTISKLTEMQCQKSPSGFHVPYEGEDKAVYTCKYCNSFSKTIKKLMRGSCSMSPNKHHQPAE